MTSKLKTSRCWAIALSAFALFFIVIMPYLFTSTTPTLVQTVKETPENASGSAFKRYNALAPTPSAVLNNEHTFAVINYNKPNNFDATNVQSSNSPVLNYSKNVEKPITEDHLKLEVFNSDKPNNFNATNVQSSSAVLNYSKPVENTITEDHLKLEVCTNNIFSRDGIRSERLASIIRALESLIPSATKSILVNHTHFLPQYASPCWKSPISSNKSLLKYLSHADTMEEEKAVGLLQHLLHVDNLRLMCLPNIFHISFPRTGSTFLYSGLIQHPKIASSKYKESHWWTRHTKVTSYPYSTLSVLYYLRHFFPAVNEIAKDPETLAIDASMSTAWDGMTFQEICEIPRLLFKLLPNLRIIFTMREPAARLISDYSYLLRKAKNTTRSEIPLTFHNDVTQQIKIFKACIETQTLVECTYKSSHNRLRLGISLYYVHVAKWLEVFPKSQFLFVKSEEMFLDPRKQFDKVWTFLGLKRFRNRKLLSRTDQNRVEHSDILNETRQILTDFFRPYNQKLASLLNDSRFLWNV